MMRYIVGIDLGTTNSALSFIDTEQTYRSIQFFAIAQLAGAGHVENRLMLPSFCYLVDKTAWQKEDLNLPWKKESQTVVGQFAKLQGSKVPTRFIQSVKSWLSHVGANRQDKILPLDAANPLERLSPVEVTTLYINHLKDAWNHTFAKQDKGLCLEEQEVILTVPASFDEIARQLTVEAAKKAGLQNVTLLEEPQAAFYSWIAQHENDWNTLFEIGQTILVCDVGGGTTDFSLIEIQNSDKGLAFTRMAVGKHLLLGGDNMDAALTYFAEQLLKEKEIAELNLGQFLQLQSEVRLAKETLLSDIDDEKTHTLILQGTGSSVIKGSLTLEIRHKQIKQFLLNGFFKIHPLEEALELQKSKGIRSMGLPYEDEPSITKQLAHFLQQSGFLTKNKPIDFVLFNGGTLKPLSFQEAIIQSLHLWFPEKSPQKLNPSSLDLAVAKGAAYYGLVRRGLGVAISSGLPRTYYLQIDVQNKEKLIEKRALTLLSRGALEGHIFKSDHSFFLRPNTAVSFQLLTSHVRLDDQEGELNLIDWNEMQKLPPIQTILRYGRQSLQGNQDTLIPVQLAIRLNEIGTLEVWLESEKTEHRWNLEFQVRANHQQEILNTSSLQTLDETFVQTDIDQAQQYLEHLFSDEHHSQPQKIVEKLEHYLDQPKNQWSLNLLRHFADSLLKVANQRKRSSEYEKRWWNLIGFCLRPGILYPLDEFRMKEMWKIILNDSKPSFHSEQALQQWICLRRIAAGLNKGQQNQLAAQLMSGLFNRKLNQFEIVKKNERYAYSEKIRTLASFERLELSLKISLGHALLKRIEKGEAIVEEFWALGRIGARHLHYGSAGHVVPKIECEQWLKKLLKLTIPADKLPSMIFVFSQLARQTNQRELNISNDILEQILKSYSNEELKQRLTTQEDLSVKEQEQIFGEQLPAGLLLKLSTSKVME